MSQLETQTKQHYDMEKVVAVVSYFTVLGWLIAVVIYGKHKSSFARFHLRQSLGLVITAAVLSFIPLIGWVLNIGVAVVWLIAIFNTFIGQQYIVPIIGEFFQEHLDFIR